MMRAEPGDYVVGAMMLLFAWLGLVLASGARDTEMYVFGLSLCGFSILFLAGQIRRHFDAVDAATEDQVSEAGVTQHG